MNKIIALAPMDGITNNAHRTVCKEIWDNQKNNYNSLYDFYRFTEFMSAEGYCRNPSRLSKHLLTSLGSSNTIAQIYGGNHEVLLQTAISIDKEYSSSFSGIELNIGCPSPKIMSCEAGSGMLRCRSKTLNIIKKLSESITKPFSIKTRSGLQEGDQHDQFDFIIESGYYCSMITIHGRTYKQSHSGQVDWDFIVKVKQEFIKRGLENIKIIGNGGLKSVEDGLQYLDAGLDGIMFGQAAMCNPRSLTSYQPDIQEIYKTIYRHLQLSIANQCYFMEGFSFTSKKNIIQPSSEQLEEIIANSDLESPALQHSVIEFRKFLFWYVSGLTGCNEFKRTCSTIVDYKSLRQEIDLYFRSLNSGL